jgi:hypothetical protein
MVLSSRRYAPAVICVLLVFLAIVHLIGHSCKPLRIPQKAGRIALLVSSCLEFHESTLPVLLASIAKTEVPQEDVFVVIGDAPAFSDGYFAIDSSYAVRAFYVPFTSFDHNALMWMLYTRSPVMQPYSWVFQVHDTTAFVIDFHKSLTNVLEEHLSIEPNLAALRLSSGFSMSMGYFKKAALHRHVSAILEQTLNWDTDPKTRVHHKGSHIEDGVFKLLESKGEHVRSITGPEASETEYNVPSPYVKSGSAFRRRQLWKRPGLYKYQANYGQAPWHVNL